MLLELPNSAYDILIAALQHWAYAHADDADIKAIITNIQSIREVRYLLYDIDSCDVSRQTYDTYGAAKEAPMAELDDVIVRPFLTSATSD